MNDFVSRKTFAAIKYPFAVNCEFRCEKICFERRCCLKKKLGFVNRWFPFCFFKKALDNLIVLRYNRYIERRYKEERYTDER